MSDHVTSLINILGSLWMKVPTRPYTIKSLVSFLNLPLTACPGLALTLLALALSKACIRHASSASSLLYLLFIFSVMFQGELLLACESLVKLLGTVLASCETGGSRQVAKVGVFTPRKLAVSENQTASFHGEIVVKHWPEFHWFLSSCNVLLLHKYLPYFLSFFRSLCTTLGVRSTLTTPFKI